MHKVGIDALSFYTSNHFLDLASLAAARDTNVDKYYVGLGQYQMSIASPDEDIVTLAANAAERVLRHVAIESIDTLIFATESGVDYSKSAGIYVHQLLGLAPHCRVLEVKQACYSCTGAIQLLLPRLQLYPHKKILIIAADISRYGFNTPGESSQGCGAAAMILSTNPRILAIEPEYGIHTEDVMDFWRPTYLDEAIVDGKYSSRIYIATLEKTWKHYCLSSKRQFSDHARFCYHNSVPKLVEKSHQWLAQFAGCSENNKEQLQEHINDSLLYSRVIGNSYTASLYIGLASLLDHSQMDLSDQRIGFYSYGSGCVAEFFSGVVQPTYHQILDTDFHQQILNSRTQLTYTDYERFYSFKLPRDGSQLAIPHCGKQRYRLAEMIAHKRIYEKICE